MPKKIKWILFFVLGLGIAAIGAGFFWGKTADNSAPKEDFQDFVRRKNNFSPEGQEVSLVAVGDIMLSRTVASRMKIRRDPGYPFIKVADFLRDADITFGNLENPITEGPAIAPFETTFRADPGVEEYLKNYGFDVLSLANNHVPDFGHRGLTDTLLFLDKAQILHAGAGKNAEEANLPVYLTRKNLTFSFLAYNSSDVVPDYYEAADRRAGTALMRIESMASAVAEAKKKSDFVIVSMHAGNEYSAEQNKMQADFAHAAIDAGAELVIGHHPHVVQPVEKYKGKYILYSLGNFIFDQSQSEDVKQGLAVKIFFDRSGVREILPYPVRIRDFSQPEFMESQEGEKILDRLRFPLSNRDSIAWNADSKEFQKIVRKTIKNDTTPGQLDGIRFKTIKYEGKEFNLALEKGKLGISGGFSWKSPEEWWVEDFAVGDANGDDTPDISLSVWKAGNYGKAKPFWIKENDMSVKNHLFLFNFIGGVMKPIWQSSNLSAPNCEIAIADADGDGKDDLIVIEGDYSQKPECKGEYLAMWKWNGWGFSNEWRSDKGNFSLLRAISIGDKTEIMADGL